jgi:hypothetical protein
MPDQRSTAASELNRPFAHARNAATRSSKHVVRQDSFDTVPWDLVLKAVAPHLSPGQKWILLYVERWLKAPLQQPDGTLVTRDRGTRRGQRSHR